ncbi:MAG: stage 0 sporulation protein [Clostridia bacterium]|nr:stage 0 sporulation protein [Clostridia bacterium]
MKIAQVRFSKWDKLYSFSLSEDLPIKINDFVVVNTNLGQEIGKLISITKEEMRADLELQAVIRLAEEAEIERVYDLKKRKEALDICQATANRLKLKMKFIDARFSLEPKKLVFAFVSENRIDFRNLVKELTTTFNLNIRLLQIGSRDQAKVQGDCGPCGLKLCCRSFMSDFTTVSTEMAEAQQLNHRGSDRISGMCGRLMCCLGFEYEGYKYLANELAPIGTKIRVENRTGTVIGHHLLTQQLDVRFPAERNDERDQIVKIDSKQRKYSLINKKKRFSK